MTEAAATNMDIHEILDHLPHRYPFVMIDRVLSMELGKEITALKNVSINEPFFPRPFPLSPCDARCINCRGDGTGGSYIIV